MFQKKIGKTTLSEEEVSKRFEKSDYNFQGVNDIFIFKDF